MRLLVSIAILLSTCLASASVWAHAEPDTLPEPEVRNYHQFSAKLATGGELAPNALADLKQRGFSRIIDLRTPAEGIAAEQQRAAELGLDWFSLPTTGELPSVERVREFGALLNDDKTLVHCRSGNRVGMMWALWQMEQGVALETAIAEGKAMGMKEDFELAIRARVQAVK